MSGSDSVALLLTTPATPSADGRSRWTASFSKFWNYRLLPSLKATTQSVNLALPENASPLSTARAILAAAASGTLAPDLAAQLVSAVGAICRIEEIEEIRDRIAALEKATRPPITTNPKTKR